MISTLLSIIVLLVVLGLLWYLVKMLPIPEPMAKIIDVAFILIAILVLLGLVFGGVSLPRLA